MFNIFSKDEDVIVFDEKSESEIIKLISPKQSKFIDAEDVLKIRFNVISKNQEEEDKEEETNEKEEEEEEDKEEEDEDEEEDFDINYVEPRINQNDTDEDNEERLYVVSINQIPHYYHKDLSFLR